ncbi:hypothetical protein CU098_010116 [Rhizopus stolonifer]|uniref:Uncharacterized protein n=1 Tax=Rhizopus stolonifer TaxID=4846 RepID=A0A367JV24_RHIST|nr:hypothetical protein CU098_010116 [Rhizopus stolonifer]
MKSTTASDALPFLLELLCHGWAQAYYLMNAGFIASHLQDNPLNPIIAVVYFLIQPKPSLLDMDKQGDETIIMLYELAKKIFEIAKTKFGSMELFLQPEVALACFPVSVVFGWFYYHVTILHPTFAGTYHFSTGPTDLCCLADDIGNTTGLLFSGLISDRLYARAIKKNGGVAVKEFCLRPIYIGIPFFVAGSIMYGWFLHAHVHWMGSFVRYTMTFILVDSNHTKAASGTIHIIWLKQHLLQVLSVSNATKNICGMIFALTAVFIRNSLGYIGGDYAVYI